MNTPVFLKRPKALAAALVLVVGLAGLGAVRASQTFFGTGKHVALKLASPSEGPSMTGFAPIVRSALPDVVNISTSKVTRAAASNPFSQQDVPPFFQQFFGPDFGEGPQQGPQQQPRQREQREE